VPEILVFFLGDPILDVEHKFLNFCGVGNGTLWAVNGTIHSVKTALPHMHGRRNTTCNMNQCEGKSHFGLATLPAYILLKFQLEIVENKLHQKYFASIV
jgi:hypothetical protein